MGNRAKAKKLRARQQERVREDAHKMFFAMQCRPLSYRMRYAMRLLVSADLPKTKEFRREIREVRKGWKETDRAMKKVLQSEMKKKLKRLVSFGLWKMK